MKLKTGDKAPEINAEDQFGKTINLADYKGSKVILYFYPKDDTPGCISEEGNILKIFDKVDTKNHTDQILAVLE